MSTRSDKSGNPEKRDKQNMPSRSFSRRAWIVTAGAGVAALAIGSRFRGSPAPSGSQTVTVYRDPNCGCCSKWIDHMRNAGFTISDNKTSDVGSIKRKHGVPRTLDSCHTSLVDGYVFEGHVPADLVERVLRERPAILGLAAPGMPQSAPGMDVGNERYDVVSFTSDGKTAVFATRP